MTIHWYDSDRITPVSFPLNLGSFSHGEAPNKKLWFYSEFTLSELHLKIEAVSDPSWKAFKIAKDFNSRPQAFVDYLGELYWFIVFANQWVPIWVKFQPEKLDIQDIAYEVNLRMTAETLV